jgi:hypothetical protein
MRRSGRLPAQERPSWTWQIGYSQKVQGRGRYDRRFAIPQLEADHHTVPDEHDVAGEFCWRLRCVASADLGDCSLMFESECGWSDEEDTLFWTFSCFCVLSMRLFVTLK